MTVLIVLIALVAALVILVSALVIVLVVVILLTTVSCSKKEHMHTFEETWTTNDEKHWKASTCEHRIKLQEGKHDFGDSEMGAGNGKSYYTCKICGYIKDAEHTHVYSEWTIQTAATLLEEGMEYRACTYAGCDEREIL